MLVMFIAVGFAASQELIQTNALPDAPNPQNFVREARPWGIYNAATGGYDEAPKTNREVWNRPFTTAHAVFLASIVYKVEVSHAGASHHKCILKDGSQPKRGEDYVQSLVPFAALTAFDWLMARHRVRFASYVAPAYASSVYFRRGTDWFRDGCW